MARSPGTRLSPATTLVIAGLALSGARPALAATPAEEIRALTGQCTRIVWVRSSGGIGHPFGPHAGEKWRIMVLDTEEGKERQLVPDWGDFHHIMITPTGTRVIWNDCRQQVWIADWEGTNARPLMKAPLAVGVAEDPPGTEWVYVTGERKVRVGDGEQPGEVWRHRIDDPSTKELVWDKSGVNDKWEFTRDGKLGASGLPWPHAGVASLPNDKCVNFGDGCTPGVSGDGTLVFHMKGMGHSGVFIYDIDGSNQRYVDFRSTAPYLEGVNDPQFWWCSFARYDRRFMTFSGPHPRMGYEQSRGNIYFLMFNAGHTGVAKYVRVTDFPEVETHAYAWIGNPKQAPEIVSQPEDARVDEGAMAAFRVKVKASPEPTYRWTLDGKALSGASGPELSFKATRAMRDAKVQCVVANPEGRAASRTATLTVALKGPPDEVLAKWDARLLANMRGALGAGKRPALSPGSKRNRREVVSIGANDALHVEQAPGMQVGMPWAKLSADEKAALALSILRQKPDDHCLVAFYLLAAGRDDEAEPYLKKGGDAAEDVRAAFR